MCPVFANSRLGICVELKSTMFLCLTDCIVDYGGICFLPPSKIIRSSIQTDVYTQVWRAKLCNVLDLSILPLANKASVLFWCHVEDVVHLSCAIISKYFDYIYICDVYQISDFDQMFDNYQIYILHQN